nr:long-chain-fatty-acid--CoA ligase [Chelativorans petroleitrophicus]
MAKASSKERVREKAGTVRKASKGSAKPPKEAPAKTSAEEVEAARVKSASNGKRSAKKAASSETAASKTSARKAAAAAKTTARTAAKAGAARGKSASKKSSATQDAATKSTGSKAARKTSIAMTSAKAAGTKRATAAAKPAPSRRRGSAAEKLWLKSYPKEIPAEIEPFRHSSLADLLLESCRNFADRRAFTSMGVSLTFAELEKASRDFAAYLQSLGLKKGARLAIMMPNVLQYPVVIMAALRAGYVIVNINALYTARELQHQLVDSGAEAIVILENFARTLQTVIKETPVRHVVVATLGDMMGLKGHLVNFAVRRMKKLVPAWSLPGHVPFRQAIRQGAAARFSPPEVTLDDVAFLQYTGGTTGVAKGAILLHRNVLANVMQNELWLQTAYLNQPRPQRPVYICALPLCHIYALTVNALMGIKLGAENVLIVNPKDIPGLVKELGKYDFNVLPGVNTLFNALLNNEQFRKLSFKSLNLTLGGGMAVQRSVAERWKEVTGRTICEGYGLSETSPVAAANRFDITEFTGTIGLPLPSTEIAIRDENGRDLKPGKVGEICIRGPQVMAGYWNKPEETKEAFTPDGFLKSGDMGVMDESGYIRIVDRKKDMILVSGFNVYPNEIEEVVAEHPGVLEVAAIGVPDEHSGEVPKIFVVKKDPSLAEQDLLNFCRERLTGYKRPRHVEFRSELPKSNVGKIVRRELR